MPDQDQQTTGMVTPEMENAYKEYVKQNSINLGKELQADHTNEDKYNAYKKAVALYYKAHKGIGDDFTPDKETLKRIVEGGTNYVKGLGQNISQAASLKNLGDVAKGTGAGALASIGDFALMPLEAASWLREKRLAAQGNYDEAADVAAQRMRDMAAIRKKEEEYLVPESAEGKAAYNIGKTVGGVALPFGLAKVGRLAGTAGEIAEAAQPASSVAKAAETAQAAANAEQLGQTVGQIAGTIAGGSKGGVGGAMYGGMKGQQIGSAIGRIGQSAISGSKTALGSFVKNAGEGATWGGLQTGMSEPVGTPMSEGVAPGAGIGLMTNYGINKGRETIQAYKEGAGTATPQAKAGPRPISADLFTDFPETESGMIKIDKNRVAAETGQGPVEAGAGVGRQSQVLKETPQEGFHEGMIKSYGKVKGNANYGPSDDVIRSGYDPETQTFHAVMGKPTVGDAIPRDRYIYGSVTPELAQRIMSADSQSGEIQRIIDEGGHGMTYRRSAVSDRKLSSLVDDLNRGKIDFHDMWGFKKSNGTPREELLAKPENGGAAPESVEPLSKAEKDQLISEGWADPYITAAGKAIARKAGEGVRGARQALATLEEGEIPQPSSPNQPPPSSPPPSAPTATPPTTPSTAPSGAQGTTRASRQKMLKQTPEEVPADESQSTSSNQKAQKSKKSSKNKEEEEKIDVGDGGEELQIKIESETPKKGKGSKFVAPEEETAPQKKTALGAKPEAPAEPAKSAETPEAQSSEKPAKKERGQKTINDEIAEAMEKAPAPEKEVRSPTAADKKRGRELAKRLNEFVEMMPSREYIIKNASMPWLLDHIESNLLPRLEARKAELGSAWEREMLPKELKERFRSSNKTEQPEAEESGS